MLKKSEYRQYSYREIGKPDCSEYNDDYVEQFISLVLNLGFISKEVTNTRTKPKKIIITKVCITSNALLSLFSNLIGKLTAGLNRGRLT